MTSAEELLKERYEGEKPVQKETRTGMVHLYSRVGVYIAAEDIDLIANLVVERLSEGKCH